MRACNLVKTTILTASFLILLLPFLICFYPSLIDADHASFGIGPSMTPTIQDGDLVAIKAVGLSDIELGDILAVRFRKLVVVHRLICLEGEGNLLRLKGDGNERPDPILYDASQMVGKVVAVYPLRYLFSSYGYFVPLMAGVLLALSSWRRPEIDVNDVLLCFIFSISMGGIIGYRLIGGT